MARVDWPGVVNSSNNCVDEVRCRLKSLTGEVSAIGQNLNCATSCLRLVLGALGKAGMRCAANGENSHIQHYDCVLMATGRRAGDPFRNTAIPETYPVWSFS